MIWYRAYVMQASVRHKLELQPLAKVHASGWGDHAIRCAFVEDRTHPARRAREWAGDRRFQPRGLPTRPCTLLVLLTRTVTRRVVESASVPYSTNSSSCPTGSPPAAVWPTWTRHSHSPPPLPCHRRPGCSRCSARPPTRA
eukprot:scaffold2534_cov364-Prasinococcus_capsulatus_cf.AAC.6